MMSFFGVGDSTYSTTVYENYGLQNYKDQVLPELSFNGSSTLENTTVAGDTSGNGMLTLINSSLNTMTFKGTVSCSGGTIRGISSVMGMVVANQTTFCSQLVLTTSKSIFTDCLVKDLFIEDSNDGKEKIIVLKGNSRVEGSIVFSQEGGIVIKSHNCTIEGGIVRGVVVSLEKEKDNP